MPPPTSGAFKIFPIFNFGPLVGDYEITNVGAPPPKATQTQVEAYLVAQISDPPNSVRLWQGTLDTDWVPAVGTYKLEFFANNRIIQIDGYGPADLFTDFPLGSLFGNIRVNIIGTAKNIGRHRKLSSIKLTFGTPGVIYTLNLDNVPGHTYVNIISSPAIYPGPPYTIGNITAINNLFGFEAIIEADASNDAFIPQLELDQFYFSGNFVSWSAQLTSTPSVGRPGSEITINDGAGKLNQLTDLELYFIDDLILSPAIRVPRGYFISRTAFSIKFILPPRLPYGGKRIIISGVGDGTEFTGSVPLAILNANLVDGSGIYTLIPGKDSDTYYERTDPANVDTIDMKIPDPFIKGGLVGQ